MTAYRCCATAAGLACTAALLLTACGGGEEPSQKPAADPGQKAAAAPAGDESAPLDEAAWKAKLYAEIPEGQRPLVETNENGEYRYSGRTETGELYNAQLGGDIKIPAAFPKEIPMYPDAVPYSAMDTEGGMSLVTVDADASESEVYQYYTEKLPASGWTVDNEVNVGGGRILKASKDELEAVIHIQEVEGGSRIGYMVGPKS